jgi:hypothetical protein
MTDVLTDRVAELANETRLAWVAFINAVHHDGGAAVIDTFRAYWRLRQETVAEHARNPYLPNTLPRLRGSHAGLYAEYQWLDGWAPSIAAGTVSGVASASVGVGAPVRPVTAEERAEYERRFAAYAEDVAAWNESVRVYNDAIGYSMGIGLPNRWGIQQPATQPPAGPVRARPAPEFPGTEDFSAALIAALQSEPSA